MCPLIAEDIYSFLGFCRKIKENSFKKVFKDERPRNKMERVNEMTNNISVESLKEENEELKKALSLCLNKPLTKRLSEAVRRMDNGEYYSEEEFFRSSPQLTA